MKNTYKVLSVFAAFAALLSACNKHEGGFDAEYVMFADTLAIYPVIQGETFKVPVVSTVSRDYDRTFAVEVIDKGSNAIENLHYRLKSNTIVIPAGKNRVDVEVEGLYNNIDYADSLGFTLRLVVPEEMEMPVHGSDAKFNLETKCVLMKIAPFDVEDFTGYCLLASTYLINYSLNGSYQRLIWTEKHPSLENTVICHDWLYDGYDVNLTLHPEDPMEPVVEVEAGQQIGDEWTAFGIIRGDNRICAESSQAYPSYMYPGQNYLTVSFRVYVTKLGGEYGTVGHYYNIMEWISDEEADRLIKDGMTMASKPKQQQ